MVRNCEDEMQQAPQRRNRQTYFWCVIQQAHDGAVVSIVLERQEEWTMTISIEHARSVGKLHQNRVDNSRSTLMLDGNRQGQVSIHVRSRGSRRKASQESLHDNLVHDFATS